MFNIRKKTFYQKILLILFGCIMGIIFLEIGMRIGGGVFLLLREERNLQSIRQKGDYTILCIGESTTAYGGDNAYPRQLERVLNNRDLGIKFTVINKGLPGANTTGIFKYLKDYMRINSPNMVITMIGINDEYRPQVVYEESKIKEALRSFRTYKLLRIMYEQYSRKVERKAGSDRSGAEYMKLGDKYKKMEKYDKAEEMYNKALELDPNNGAASSRLTEIYNKLYFSKKKPMKIRKNNYHFVLSKARWYRDEGRYAEAANFFEALIKVDPEAFWGYFELGGCYKLLGDYERSEAMYKKAIEIVPGRHWAYRGLVQCYLAQGKTELAAEASRKADQIELERYVPMTYENYHAIKELIRGYGLKLVCVQYPCRRLELLKRLVGDDKDILFVDNEWIFKQAIKREGYEAYFLDSFGGDFGHCTPRGNRLLAENIADKIEEFLKKEKL